MCAKTPTVPTNLSEIIELIEGVWILLGVIGFPDPNVTLSASA